MTTMSHQDLSQILTLTPVSELETTVQSPMIPSGNSNWTTSFRVPLEKCRASLRRKLNEKEKPDISDRRHMVRMMVDEMRQHCLNPTLSQCAFIAKGIIEKYPNSLQDRTEEGEKMGSGHYTLCQQLKSRVDNLNRNNTLARMRKERRPAVTPAATAGNSEPARKCAKTDSYGCINWQPIVLPEGEMKESLLHKKEELKLIFSHEGQRGADRARVAELMETTFETQRRNINMLPAMQKLIKEWPFLFQKRFLLDHFNQLTGIELDARLRESMESKGKRVMTFFQSQLLRWGKEVRTVLANLAKEPEVDPCLAVVLTMMAFFHEKEDALFILADVSNCFMLFP